MTTYTATLTDLQGVQREFKRNSDRTYTHLVTLEYREQGFDEEAYKSTMKGVGRARGKDWVKFSNAALAASGNGEFSEPRFLVLGFCGSLELAQRLSQAKGKRSVLWHVLRTNITPLEA